MASIITPSVRAQIERAVADNSARVQGVPGATLELEARFRIDPGDVALFQRVREVFASRTTPIEVNIVDTVLRDHARGVWRKSVVTRQGQDDATVTYTHKRPLWRHDDNEFDVRIALSIETEYERPPEQFARRFEEEGDDGEVVRTKQRTSFFILDSAVRVDMTKVRMHVPGHEMRTSHEIEIEVVDGRNVLASLDRFRQGIGYLLTVIQESDIPISRTERTAVIAYIATLIDDRTPARTHELATSSLVQARDLTIRDMVYGGLVGNPHTSYTVTIKADGERRLLVFTRWGVFFAQPRTRLCKISRLSPPEFEGTILDGEYLPASARLHATPDMLARHVWYAFDCLADRGSTSIRKQDHFKRLEACLRITQALAVERNGVPPIPNATLRTKDFLRVDTPQRFFYAMARIAQQLSNIPYEEDGVMFTPISTPYLPTGGGRRPGGRVTLVDAPAVCKWKPAEKHSVDLAVTIVAAIGRDAGALPFDLAVTGPGRSAPGGGPNLVPWRGTGRHPFTPQRGNVDLTTPVLSESSLPAHGTIIEFRWDHARGMLVPMRLRRDKVAPNFIDVARDVWNNMMNPLEWSTLIGTDFRQLRSLHNLIKKDLIDSIGRRNLVVDIGSGNGGDIAKWGNFAHVVGIEPDPEHRAEMARRLKLADRAVARRIEVHPGSGTDLLAAVPDKYHGRADAVMFMLSLSFFFDRDPVTGEQRDLDALARGVAEVLAPGRGVIAFLTVNGEAVVRVLRPDLATPATPARAALDLGERGTRGAPVASPMRSPRRKGIDWSEVPGTVVRLEGAGGGEPTAQGPNRLFIHLPNSIVENQTEFLVDIGAFVRALERAAPGRGWHLAWHERTASDPRAPFLPPVSDTLNRMYSYGVIAQGGEPAAHLSEPSRDPPVLPPGALEVPVLPPPTTTIEEAGTPSRRAAGGGGGEVRGGEVRGDGNQTVGSQGQGSPSPLHARPWSGEQTSQGVDISYRFHEIKPGQWALSAELVNPEDWRRVVQAVSDAGCSVSDEDEIRRAVLAYVASTGGRIGTVDELAIYAAELLCIGPLSSQEKQRITAAELRRIEERNDARGFAVYGQTSTKSKKSWYDTAYDAGLSEGVRVIRFVDLPGGAGVAAYIFRRADDSGVERVHFFPPRGFLIPPGEVVRS